MRPASIVASGRGTLYAAATVAMVASWTASVIDVVAASRPLTLNVRSNKKKPRFGGASIYITL